MHFSLLGKRLNEGPLPSSPNLYVLHLSFSFKRVTTTVNRILPVVHEAQGAFASPFGSIIVQSTGEVSRATI